MLSDDEHFVVSLAEQRSVDAVLGETAADLAAQSANQRFQRWFVESGAVKFSVAGAAGDNALPDGGTAELGMTWVRHLWMTLYRALYRAAVAHHWLIGGLLLLAATLNDGAVSRRIKAAVAGFANPVSFHVAAHGLLVTFGVGTSALLLPGPLVAYWWTGGTALIGLLSWRLAASFHVGR